MPELTFMALETMGSPRAVMLENGGVVLFRPDDENSVFKLIGVTQNALWQATVAAAAGVTDYFTYNFGDMRETKGVILRGAAQELALTFPVVLASAGTLSVDIEWTEE